jgi:biopolymer transport protein ExbD
VSGTSRSGARGPIAGINVTPMVDVMLVLLVIMMVSATYIVQQSLKVELPKTQSSDEPAVSPLRVTVTRDAEYFLDDQSVGDESLRARLASAAQVSSDVNVIITADEHASHGSVVHVIDVAKVAGITKFAINVDRSK